MTTWSLDPTGGGDYTSANALFANASTVASDIGEAQGDWTSDTDTAATTFADDNLTFRSKASDQARHAGFDNAGSNYELAVTSGHCLTISNTGGSIENLLIHLNNSGASNECVRMGISSGTLTAINNVFRGNEGGSSNQDGIYAEIPCTINMENNYFTQFGRSGINAAQTGATEITVNAISVGMYECGLDASNDAGGFLYNSSDAGSTINFNIHNSWVADSNAGSSNDYHDNGPGTDNWNIDNCFATDASISANDGGAVNATENASITAGVPGAGDIIAVNSLTAPYDFTLQDDANNDAQTQHSNASGAGLTIGDYTTGDIAGTARSAPYDVGPHRATAPVAGGLSIPVAMRAYRNLRTPF